VAEGRKAGGGSPAPGLDPGAARHERVWQGAERPKTGDTRFAVVRLKAAGRNPEAPECAVGSALHRGPRTASERPEIVGKFINRQGEPPCADDSKRPLRTRPPDGRQER
jgi:hypothetical protein